MPKKFALRPRTVRSYGEGEMRESPPKDCKVSNTSLMPEQQWRDEGACFREPPSHVNRCHPAVIKRASAGGSAGGGNHDHRPLVFISSLTPFNVFANSKISRGRSRKEGRGGRMSKCEGCRLKEPFASPDIRHLLTSKQRRVIKPRLRPEDWPLRSLAPTQHVW